MKRRLLALGLVGVVAVVAQVALVPLFDPPRRPPTADERARDLLARMRVAVEDAHRRSGKLPSDRLDWVLVADGLPNVVPRNTLNEGIESLYRALRQPGGVNVPIPPGETCNTDDDGLHFPSLSPALAALPEIRDPWGNPLVYFVAAHYAQAERDRPAYLTDAAEMIVPRPWRSGQGGFAEPDSFQLYSVGPDGLPNTDDDVTGWDRP